MKKCFYVISFVLTISNLFSQSSWASFVLKDSICEGSSTNILANTGTVIASGYTWTALPSGPMISAPNSSTTPITFPSSGTYTVSLTAASGTNISTSFDTIVVLSLPTLSVSGPTSPICPPPTSIGGLWMTGSGASTYTWNPGNITGATYWQMQPSVSTIFTLNGTDSLGCTNFTTYYVQVLPQINIYVPTPSIVCDGSYMLLTESGGDLTFWVWTDACGNNWTGGPTTVMQASLACGNTFTVGGNNGNCMNYASFTLNISPCTEMAEIGKTNDAYEIYPNPVVDKLNIKIASTEETNTNLEVSDISGRIISKSKCIFDSKGVYTIDVSEFSPGIYFARIISENKISKPIKIIKE